MAAFVIAGTQSGSGKTTVSLGLMAALARQGRRVQPFKCGPDFIDPTLHELATGSRSRNLDPWMAGEEHPCRTFARHAAQADVAIIEGVMGMFDGGASSSASLAELLQVPLVLVLDVRSAAESAAAVLKGFEELRPQVAPRAVILNRVASPRHLQLVSEAIRNHCQAEILGYLPRTIDFTIPERHLGLHMGGEGPLRPAALRLLAETVSEHIDLERLLALTASKKRPSEPAPAAGPPRIRLAVARDEAFCFYYEDNFDLLRQAGAEIVFFSPLTDTMLPPDIDAIYLGGGYPELHAARLAGNRAMRQAIRRWAEDDGVIYAECGGFMYLCQAIVNQEGHQHEMAGVFPVQAHMRCRRASLGYRQITLRRAAHFGEPSTVLRGHEFHYSAIDEMPAAIDRVYGTEQGELEGYLYKNVLGGYMHLHFGFSPQAVAAFIGFVEKQGEGKK